MSQGKKNSCSKFKLSPSIVLPMTDEKTGAQRGLVVCRLPRAGKYRNLDLNLGPRVSLSGLFLLHKQQETCK